MRILLVNKFLYRKGGCATSVINTGELLTSKGHDVEYWGMSHPDNPQYTYQDNFVENIDFQNVGGLGKKLARSANILYSFDAKKKFREVIENFQPDIVHLNNIAHQLSPSVLDVLKQKGIPAVMTMHDYKMVCAIYTLLADGELCDRCANGKYYWCTVKRCTKKTLSGSLVNTLEMYLHHRVLHIYDHIHTYISPSQFMANKTREMGLRGRSEHLPNFVNLDGLEPNYQPTDKSIVYVGRISHEKGLVTLIDAIKGVDVELRVIGDGPLFGEISDKVRQEKVGNVKLLGYLSGNELRSEIRNSMFLVIPSEWYENNPLTVIEAFALGKPAVGARIGGIPELVVDGQTGLTYSAFDASDLREKIERLLASDQLTSMGRRARQFVETELDGESHYEKLMPIYRRAKKSMAQGDR